MSQESNESFVDDWLNSARKKRQDSKIQQIIERHTKEQVLDEEACFNEILKRIEEHDAGDDDVSS